MKIGVLIIATNKYIQFVPDLVKSIEQYFLCRYEVKNFLFTDHDRCAGCEVIPTEHKPWPAMTYYRYHIFSKHKQIFSKMDYLFYLDADMKIVDPVNEEILQDITATIHPGFYNKHPNLFTYERNRSSQACIVKGAGVKYYAGGFQGGKTFNFLLASEQIKNRIDIDDANGIHAIHNDESHWNKYLFMNPPKKPLSPAYCYPESGKIPFEKKILALDKDHKFMRSE